MAQYWKILSCQASVAGRDRADPAATLRPALCNLLIRPTLAFRASLAPLLSAPSDAVLLQAGSTSTDSHFGPHFSSHASERRGGDHLLASASGGFRCDMALVDRSRRSGATSRRCAPPFRAAPAAGASCGDGDGIGS